MKTAFDRASYLNTLLSAFEAAGDKEIAEGQEQYMKNRFKFYGIKSNPRKEIQKPFFEKSFLPPIDELESIVKFLWNKPYRELHYFAQELAYLYRKQFRASDLQMIEWMLLNQSWWDSVDFISVHLAGNYFRLYPEQTEHTRKKWLHSGEMWLQRASMLYQMKYKKDTDVEWLLTCIRYLKGSKEFFINKAIGWALREYRKTDQDWVISVTETEPLHPLSKREALVRMK